MTVSASGRESLISQALYLMLANCAEVQTLTGAANRTAALSFIIEDYGGEQDNEGFKAVDGATLNPDLSFFTVRLLNVQVDKRARDTYGWTAEAEIVLNMVVTAADAPAEKLRRVRNSQGAIRAQLEAQIGSTTPITCILSGLFNSDPVYLADVTTANRLHLIAPISVSIGDLP